jgi:holo-[acyl-carrier protein] synthase
VALTTGVDIVEVARVYRAVERHGERFLARIYTGTEVARYGGRVDELAGRFAAKEAASKALGVGLRHMSAHGIGWHDVEVLSDRFGKPVLRLSGRARVLAEEQGLRQWSVSLSHDREYAIALVVATD